MTIIPLGVVARIILQRPVQYLVVSNRYTYLCYYSYLKSLVPVFNECVDQFLERLRPLADGKTQVSMKEQFDILTLDVISKVLLSAWTSTIMNNMFLFACGIGCFWLRL